MEKNVLALMSCSVFLNFIPFVEAEDIKNNRGYYISAKATKVYQKAHSMDTSLRPGIGQFVSAKDKHNFYNSSLAIGYNLGYGWRAEGEYTFNKKSEYTSGSTNFPTSFNHMKIENQRFMVNIYKSFYLDYGFSIYGNLGLGVAKIKTDGWQGNSSRQYAKNTDTNFVYSVGAGVSYALLSNVSLDLGYRFVDIGKVESGMNNFANVRGLQDEQ